MRLRPLALFVWAGVLLNAASINPDKPFRFIPKRDSIVHVSLHRSYDQMPGDVEIVEIRPDGSVSEWNGAAPSFNPENTQTHPGILSFRAGKVTVGRIYEARASLPGELDVQFFADQANADPKRAVEMGTSWLIRAADAWLSNQPRQGAVAREGQVQHPEARACIACHITQFPTRAYLTAVQQGYPAQDPAALAAVIARLRSNPRPLYGHSGVNWARVIYSARTVSSRLPVLLSMYRQVTHEDAGADRDLTLGAARFLLLSDECGVGQLRPEADGSRPDVSGFEIGLQAWETFRLAAGFEPDNPQWLEQSACMERILGAAKPSNTIDAAWRIVALKRMVRPTESAITELLRYQQPDGRFALGLTKDGPPSDFISYHVLYALAVAGYRGPEVETLAAYALRSQRPDGSWKGAPDYKGFDTPFRDTQFAVMALSHLYPQQSTAPISLKRKTIEPDYWRAQDRDAIQRRILERMADEKQASKPLIEDLSATLDENLGQLREWQRLMRNPSDQSKVEQALRADSQRQARLLANTLDHGSRTQRLRVLSALSTVVGIDGFPKRTRVGNDMEPPQILSDDNAELEKAIVACIDENDRELTEAAIRAGTALTDVITPAFTKSLLRLLPEYGPAILQAWGPESRGRLTLSRGIPVDTELQELVRETLSNRDSEALSLTLPLLASLEHGHPFTREPYLTGAMERLLRDRLDGQTLEAGAVFWDILNGPMMRSQVMEALESPNPSLVRAAVNLVLERYLVNPNVFELTIQYFAASRGLARRMLLDALDPDRIRFRVDQVSAYSPPRIPIPADANILGLPHVQSFVLSSLKSSDPQVQAAALDLTRKQGRLLRNADIQIAIESLSASLGARNRTLSRSLRAGTPPLLSPDNMLDFDFFRQRIEPIIQKPGSDGRSCVMCHASNARFPLRGDAGADFRSLTAKVDLLNPVNSPILVKPLLPAITSDGDVFRTSHNGGQRWPDGNGSAEYQTILEWIRGGQILPQRAGISK